jgi:pimeloyl-ACP methyl ester carboxylesterase
VNPFFFGPSSQPLYGVYHPPHSQLGRTTAVVLCYPLGQEYMRAHRAFRQLALLLSKAGFHVLRFDYYGTGDSAGFGEQGTIEQWTQDIGLAIDELKEMAELDDVALVGLRLGGTLAAYAAHRREDVSHLVLWDAVGRGSSYLERELRPHATGPTLTTSTVAADSVKPSTSDVIDRAVGVMGFPLSSALLASLAKLDLFSLATNPATERFIVVSSDTPEQRKLADAWSNDGRCTFLCVPSEGNWNEVDDFGSALIPQAIIRAIVDHLSNRA